MEFWRMTSNRETHTSMLTFDEAIAMKEEHQEIFPGTEFDIEPDTENYFISEQGDVKNGHQVRNTPRYQADGWEDLHTTEE